MRKNIKINIEKTGIDKSLDIISLFLLIIIWLITIINYRNLPSMIPIHYNAMGVVDNNGSKIIILSLPLIATFLYILMTIATRFPYLFNYPVKITLENAKQQYTISVRLIKFLKISILIIFSLIEIQTIQIAQGNSDRLGVWFLPFSLGLIFIPLFLYIKSSIALKNK